LQRITATNTFPGATSEHGAKHLGTEFGLTADWKHSDNVRVGVGAAMYEAGGYVKQNIASTNSATVSAANNPAVMSFADLSVKF
ncbi:MAG: hypothetical protein KGL53_04800, partial [Elusimicrobia bacterium]|nr:hypothetical protein [Elusimicrobiota bacterium]